MRSRAKRIPQLLALTWLVALVGGTGIAAAGVHGQLRTVTYHGYSVTIPRSWPVYDLATAPQTCVRFNRHALYLGRPSTEQRCSAQAVGRTEAILIEPLGASGARAGSSAATTEPVAGEATTFSVPASGVEVTATWLQDPQLIIAALHRRALPAPVATAAAAHLQPRSSARAAAASSSVLTGLGFDACNVPSARQMSAWTSYSPYHAIGVYIGGANAACPPSTDPNLSITWLSNEAAAGWHYIPTYVGLQAPTNSCGCAPIKPSQASAEGTAAADDAVSQAQGLDLPTGTPIYDDMEYYSRTQTNSSAVLAFLAAWTSELHAKGYLSGVYGNSDSAIADLVTQYGTSYPEPDDIWFAAWNGQQSTEDPNIPSGDWQNHQRLHQYTGSHDETYGGVTLNIDSDYLDGATAGSVIVGPPPPPTLSVSPTATGATKVVASWSGFGLVGWQVLAGTSPTALSPIAWASLQGAQTTIIVPSAAPYFEVQALGPSGQILASSAPVATPAHLKLFGHSSFLGIVSGVGGVPVGCYLASACHLVATISSGRTIIARSTPQTFRAGGSGFVYYKLTAAGSRKLGRTAGAHLPVQIALKDASGAKTSANMVMIAFATSGRSPTRALTPGATIAAAGGTEFVDGGAGGILARCISVSACQVTATLKAGGKTIAASRQQQIDGLELGYIYFSLNSRGRALLKSATGNQLAASLVLRSGTSVASARIALVQYS